MKKSLLLGVAVLTFVVAGTYLYVHLTAQPVEPLTVVAFGDSLTFGRGSEGGGGYVSFLSEELGMPIINLGIVGDTTQRALRRIDQVENWKPGIVVVLLGGNDFLTGVPQEETFKNLGKIIEILQSNGSQVVLVGLEPIIAKNGERQAFDALAKKYKTAYVPNILQGVYGHLDMMSDNLHPNDIGYALMAERIAVELKRLLR